MTNIQYVLILFLIFILSCGPAPQKTKSESHPEPEPIRELVHPPALRPEPIQIPLGHKAGGVFTLATDLYGPLRVSVGAFFVDTQIRPWSGPWLPFSDSYLFKELDSPLQKYDRYVQQTRHVISRAAEYESNYFYQPDSMGWAGRCDAWALASLLEPEPLLKQPIELEGVLFTAADLKALLALTYTDIQGVMQFGQRYNGDHESVAEDIYPEQFHKIIQREMFENKKAVIIDKDPGIEVWNTPIYKAAFTIGKDKNDSYLLHVYAALVGANPLPLVGSGVAELNHRNIVFEYTYDLYGYPQERGEFQIVYGVWTGNSIHYHPDFVWALPAQRSGLEKRGSLNQELDVSIVDEIVAKALASSTLFK